MLIAFAGPYPAETAEQRQHNMEALSKPAAVVMKRGTFRLLRTIRKLSRSEITALLTNTSSEA